jgi:simple sugar transport system substrate-binding protein
MRRTLPRAVVLSLILALSAVAVSQAARSTHRGTTATPLAAATTHSAAGGKYKIVMVTHGPGTATFWVTIYTGLIQAGKDLGINVTYRGTSADLTDPNGERQLILNAIAQHPDGIVVTDPQPNIMNPILKKIKDAGIPFVLMNAGIGQSQAVGALGYVGNNEVGAGALGAQKLNALGGKHALILTIPPGQVPLVDDRYNGFKKAFKGKVTTVTVPLTSLSDPNKIKNAFQASLQKDKSIDSVFSIGSCCSAPELAARASLGARGTQMHWGTIDITPDVLTAIKGHQMDFAFDQQPFNQAYLSVVFLNNYLRYGLVPAQANTPTGPALIDASNVDVVIKNSKSHAR